METKRAPYSLRSLFLGLSSILCSPIFIGLFFGIYGLIFAKRGMQIWKEDPKAYYNKGILIAGKVFSIIGIVLSGFIVLIGLLLAIFLLIDTFSPEWGNKIASYYFILLGMLSE